MRTAPMTAHLKVDGPPIAFCRPCTKRARQLDLAPDGCFVVTFCPACLVLMKRRWFQVVLDETPRSAEQRLKWSFSQWWRSMRFRNRRPSRLSPFPEDALLERFCTRCRGGISRGRKWGMRFVPCSGCIDMLHSFLAVNQPPLPPGPPPPPPRPEEGTAPWRWDGDTLVDAHGRDLMLSTQFGDFPATRRVDELMRAAPGMEALLRKHEWVNMKCPECGKRNIEGHDEACAVAKLLVTVDLPATPFADELMRAAPEMEALLRKHEWVNMQCPECGERKAEGHDRACPVAKLLTQIPRPG